MGNGTLSLYFDIAKLGSDTEIQDCDIAILETGYLKTGLSHCHIMTCVTGILDWDIAVLEHITLDYLILILLYWNTGYLNTGL